MQCPELFSLSQTETLWQLNPNSPAPIFLPQALADMIELSLTLTTLEMSLKWNHTEFVKVVIF